MQTKTDKDLSRIVRRFPIRKYRFFFLKNFSNEADQSHPSKNYTIDTFLRHRLLNPIEIKNSEKIFTFRQIFEV